MRLRDRSVASELLRVRGDRGRRDTERGRRRGAFFFFFFVDSEGRPPFREGGPLPLPASAGLGEPLEPSGGRVPFHGTRTFEGGEPGVGLHPDEHALPLQQRRHGGDRFFLLSLFGDDTIESWRSLAQRLLEDDAASDAALGEPSSVEAGAPGAAGLFVVLEASFHQPLPQGRRGLVGGQDAASLGDELGGDGR